MTHPQCFTQPAYDDWLEWRRRSKEAVSVCDDCTNKWGYIDQMKEQGRCQPAQTKRVTIYRIKRGQVTLSPITETVNNSILGKA